MKLEKTKKNFNGNRIDSTLNLSRERWKIINESMN